MKHEYPIVAFLQNAWFKPGTKQKYIDRYITDHDYRSRVLAMSRTGSRIIKTFGSELYDKMWWENSTTKVGDVYDARFQPDPVHMLQTLVEKKPKIVVCFGQNAEHILRLMWTKSLLVLPHPGYRCATDKIFVEGSQWVHKCLENEAEVIRFALRQKKGYFETEPLKIEM